MSRALATALAALFLLAAAAAAAEPLRIGIHEKPPYATQNPDGSWSGLGVMVWEAICKANGFQYTLVPTPYESLLSDISSGKLDAAVGELEVTADAVDDVDFTQPYIVSSVGIALPERTLGEAWRTAVAEFFNWEILRVIIGILAALVIVSILVWLAERRHHAGHFRGGIHGFGSAFWFSAVTMTTVGYGDKTPSTFLGRTIAIAWMLAGVLLVSAFTATVTSSMSASRLSGSISSVAGVHNLLCGVLRSSSAEGALAEIGIRTVPFEDLRSALAELGTGRIEAVVADRNTLLYYQRHSKEGGPRLRIRVLDFTLRDSLIAIPIRKGQGNYEKINQSLLEFTGTPAWQTALRSWIGTLETPF
jgi:ABC-type amino acid transport substrate-binding protein